MALQLVITNAGRAAVIDQANGGFRAVRIAAVGVSPTAINAAPASANLPDEVKRITSIAGEATATDVTHLTVTDESGDSYTVRSFALYLSDGTLFALYGQADPIVQKSAQALLLLAIDVALSNVPAAAITFGNANFTNPAATTERAGVVELATEAEAATLADATRALTPKAMTAIFTAANVLSRLLAVDGAGSGLDADTVDGRQAAEFALLSGAFFEGRVHVRNPGAEGVVTLVSTAGNGAGLRLNTEFPGGNIVDLNPFITGVSNNGFEIRIAGNRRMWIAGDTGIVTSATGFLSSTFTATSSITRNGLAVWDPGNDGAGSGLDADLLDGHQASEFALLGAANAFEGAMRVRATGATAVQTLVATEGGGAVLRLNSELAGGNVVDVNPFITGVSNNGFEIRVAGNRRMWIAGDTGIVTSATGFLSSTFTATSSITRNGLAVWDPGNDGAGSGLDADMLDGRNASEFALLSGAEFSGPIAVRTPDGGTSGGIKLVASPASGAAYFQILDWTGNVQWGLFGFGASGLIRWNDNTVWHAGNDGAGSTLDADLVDGWHRDEIRDWNNLLNRPTSVWHAGNDGAGSGLDADLLDGWHRDEIRDWGNLLNKPAAFPVAAHTHGAADIAGAFPGSLSGNGYTILPNGLILQWVTGAQQAASSEGTQYVAFPIAFNTCFQVITSTQVANPNIESHAIYQLIGFTTDGATVMRQLVSASGADREPSWPRLFAIGR